VPAIGLEETYAFVFDRHSDMLREADENRVVARFDNGPSTVVVFSQAVAQRVARLRSGGFSGFAGWRAHHPKTAR
jgi:hypothetical protein